MALFPGVAAGGLAAAFRQFRDSGVPREALEQALSEAYQDQAQAQAQRPFTQEYPPPDVHTSHSGQNHHARLSVSTTSSKSSGRSRSSVLSTATSITSTSSQPARDKPTPAPPADRPAGSSGSGKTASTPRFWCTSCETTFARKYDWKRHEEEFHERYRRYPCPGCNRVFWGANTFNQHHKSAHNCTTCPHAQDVVVYTKRKRAWGCGVCAAFLPSRDRFFDHVAKHFEAGLAKPDHWTHSKVIYGLLHQPHVNQAWKDLVSLLWGDHQPGFSWNPDSTGRAPGFLENGSPGKLQDFLEFFSDKSVDVHQLVQLAHDQADIIPRFSPTSQIFQHLPPLAGGTSHPPSFSLDPPPLGSNTADPRISSSSLSSSLSPSLSLGSTPAARSTMQSAAVASHHPHLGQPPDPGSSSLVDEDQTFSPLSAHHHHHISGIRFPETILEVPEAEYYDMAAGSTNTLAAPGGLHPPHRSDDWSSAAATIVDDQMWADTSSASRFQSGHQLTG